MSERERGERAVRARVEVRRVQWIAERKALLSLSLSLARALSLSLSLSVLTYGIADGSREFVSTATEHTVRVLSGACGTRFSVGGLCV
jgi:hypothetical protein